MHTFHQADLQAREYRLSEDESKHCVRVLRLRRGDRVRLIDGKGGVAVAVIDDDNPKGCVLRTVSAEHHVSQRKVKLHLGIAPTKSPERLEWFLEKAVEMGIEEISLMHTEHSERPRVNMERISRIAISALKQSGRYYLPVVHPMRPFSEVIASAGAGQLKLIAWCGATADDSLFTLMSASALTEVMVLIGPEGDFAKSEIALASAAGFETVSLGPSVMRSETAALFTVACVKCFADAPSF